jgi:hypothetical protein
MNGRLEIPVIDDIDVEHRALAHAQHRTRDRPVIGKHPHRRIADALGDRCDAQLKTTVVAELDRLGAPRERQISRRGRERGRAAAVIVVLAVAVVVMIMMVDLRAPFGAYPR